MASSVQKPPPVPLGKETDPLLLDLFCGAGGCAVGYARAGFRVVGVDHKPQPRYPFEFIQGDALTCLRHLLRGGDLCVEGRNAWYTLSDFAAIHASPPCQAFVQLAKVNVKQPKHHPDLLAPTRDLLFLAALPWVIENVPGAPLHNAVTVCGSAFDLGVRRHRKFESSHVIFGTNCQHHKHEHRGVYGKHPDGGRIWTRKDGHGIHRSASIEDARLRMGIDWMDWSEITQAIPPAYTHFIGKQLRRVTQ